MSFRFKIFLEFLLFGIMLGIVEDLIAIVLVTGEPIDFRVIFIVILVTIPFAFIAELVADRNGLIPKNKKK